MSVGWVGEWWVGKWVLGGRVSCGWMSGRVVVEWGWVRLGLVVGGGGLAFCPAPITNCMAGRFSVLWVVGSGVGGVISSCLVNCYHGEFLLCPCLFSILYDAITLSK